MLFDSEVFEGIWNRGGGKGNWFGRSNQEDCRRPNEEERTNGKDGEVMKSAAW